MLLLVALSAAPREVRAQAPEQEWLRLQARAGMVWRSGAQAWPNPGLDYSGWTPSDLSLAAQAYTRRRFAVGGFLSIQREGFGLLEGDRVLTSGALWRAALGPAARFSHPWFEVDGGLGYELAQLPHFADPSAPQLEALTRHGLLARLGLRVPLVQGVQLHAAIEAPLTLALDTPRGAGNDVQGLTVGGALAVPVARVQDTQLRALLSYQAVFDRWRLGGPETSGQGLQRLGLALEGAWGSPAAAATNALEPSGEEVETAPSRAVLRLRITSAGDGLALPGARARIGEREVESDARGWAVLEDLPPGALAVSVTAETFQPTEEVLTLVPGQLLELELALKPAASREPAVVAGQVRSAGTGRPVTARLEVSGMPLPVHTDAAGRFELEMAAGTYRVEISAEGHLTQRKKLEVRPGERAILNVDLHPRRQ